MRTELHEVIQILTLCVLRVYSFVFFVVIIEAINHRGYKENLEYTKEFHLSMR